MQPKRKLRPSFDFDGPPVRREVKRKITRFRTLVLSRHTSHSPLRTQLELLPFRSLVRLGSTTSKQDDVTHGGARVECNTVQAVRTSASKALMKRAFTDGGVTTADWSLNAPKAEWFQDGGKALAKHIHGSRGTGNYMLETMADFETWRQGKTIANYVFEKFYTYTREYRVHVTKEGPFYSCRKMLRRDAPAENSWQRHDDNCVWILEENPSFDRPRNWNTITADCVRALNAVGLDIGAFDVKVQSARDSKNRQREEPKWIIIESASAPGLAEVGLRHYLTQIPRVLRRKHG